MPQAIHAGIVSDKAQPNPTSLAYAEMRLILAHMIFHFDLELADDSRGWLQGQKAFQLWDKPPLNVYLTPVASKSG